MSDEEGGPNIIDIEEDEEEDENKVSLKHIINILQEEGMQIDLSKAMEECKGIEKIEARNDTGKVSKILYD